MAHALNQSVHELGCCGKYGGKDSWVQKEEFEGEEREGNFPIKIYQTGHVNSVSTYHFL